MADTTTLTPTLTSQPREKGKKPSVFGGFNDLIGETFELVARGQGDFVNEGPVRAPESFEAKEPVATAVPEVYKKVFSSGSIENFQQPDPEKIIEAAIVQSYQQKKELTLEDMARYGLAGATKQELATEGNYQPNYEGESVESKYNLIWVFCKRIGKAIKERIKSSFNPFEVLSKKTSSKAAVSGANDLLLNASAQEGQSMTSSAGAVRGAG